MFLFFCASFISRTQKANKREQIQDYTLKCSPLTYTQELSTNKQILSLKVRTKGSWGTNKHPMDDYHTHNTGNRVNYACSMVAARDLELNHKNHSWTRCASVCSSLSITHFRYWALGRLSVPHINARKRTALEG